MKSDMKSKILAFLAVIALFSAVIFAGGCNGDSGTSYSKKPAEAMKLEKVSEYLYKIRYNDIDYSVTENWSEEMKKTYEGKFPYGSERASACTAAVNGNIYGRNLDFSIGHYPEFIVWVDGKEGRYASMAVSALLNVDRKEAESGKLSEDAMRIIPFMIFDGINEKGVTCNMNYVPKDVKHDSTNPGAEELPYFLVIRYVLDNAASAAEGVELLRGRNLVDKPALSSLHWIIADPKESYLVEIVDNKLCVIPNPKAMTNYYLSVDGYTPHACGIQRMDIVKRNYDKANTVEGMRSLLQSVHYTQAYKKETNPFWYSEHYFADKKGKDYTINTPMDEMQAHVDEIVDDFSRCTRENPGDFWETVHSSVYDMSKQTMRISQHEDYGKYWDFKLK